MKAIRNRDVTATLSALAILLWAGLACAAPDYAREKRLADEVVPTLVIGDAVTIETHSGLKFLGLLTPAAKPRAGVILVHGVGVHPDFGVIGQLRSGLADRGYTTLSIQMPVLAADANPADYVSVFPEAGERLEAAIDYLRGKGNNRIALVSHSMGARMANDFIARRANTRLMAWVPLAISSGRFESLADVRLPIFDIYAERDFDVVLQGAPGREKVLRSHLGSKQAMVYQADHYFAKKEKEVAALIDQLLTPLAK
jgi:alpha-beta hydrolase superfamily lysophospholipase